MPPGGQPYLWMDLINYICGERGLTLDCSGIILSGSPFSVYDPAAPHVDPDVFTLGVPVLGICYGLQEIARTHGGNVEAHAHREYGYAKIRVEKVGGHGDRLFEGIEMEEDGGLQVSAGQLNAHWED